MADTADLLRRLRRALGAANVLATPAARAVYARDASHLTLGEPLCACLPADEQGVAAVLRLCREAGVPVVVRGAGTGLSGGAVPPAGAVVLSLRRLDGVAVDAGRSLCRAGAGALNGVVDRRAGRHGLTFAPDPGSRSAATIGGNVAENAGGPHAVRDGVTLHHVRSLTWYDAAGRRCGTGDRLAPWPAVDLAALLTGSEGILGVVTAATLQLVPAPPEAVTLLAYFDDLEAAADAVAKLLRSGLQPAALELIDHAMLEVVEAAFGFGLRTDAAGALIVELAGERSQVAAEEETARRVLREAGAVSVDAAADPARREQLWRCRRRAFGGVGRLAPDYVTMDVVVPPGRLPGLVAAVQAAADRHGVRIATVGHAGDGNLHPGVMFDPDVPGARERAQAAADAVMEAALALGGSVTGEHGIGIEKLHVVARQLDPEALRLMRSIVRLADPRGLLNPGKGLPPQEEAGTPGPPSPDAARFDWDSLLVSAPATTPLAAIQREAISHGLWLPVGFPPAGPTLGELATWGLSGPAPLAVWRLRDLLLEVWAETGDGRRFHAGRPVLKNVAGLDLVRLVTGNGGLLASVEAMTLRLAPLPPAVGMLSVADPTGAVAREWYPLLIRRADRHLAPCLLHAEDVTTACWLEPAGRGAGEELERRLREAAAGREPRATLAPPAELWGHLAGLVPACVDWSVRPAVSGTALPPVSPGIPLVVTGGVGPLQWLATSMPPVGAGWSVPIEDGRHRPPPPPPPDVPLSLLRGLKDLFDPDGRLLCPDWLGKEAS